MNETVSLDLELNHRIDKAAAFGAVVRLNQQIWSTHKLKLAHKMSVYRACVVSTLLYGSES